MRIAIFTETFLPKIDGVVTILCQALERLQAQGHTVLLFGPPGGPEQYAGATIVGVGGPRLPFYPELRMNIPRRFVWEQLQAFRPDLIHVASPFFLGPFGIRYARRLNLPLLASFHTHVPRYARYYGGAVLEPLLWRYLRFWHNQAHVNLCPSTATLKELREHGFARVRWWQRGIDTTRFSPGPRDMALRERLSGGHPDELLVLYVGRHSPEKRLELIRDPLFSVPGVRLAMVGGGPSHDTLRRHFRGTPTTFPGYLRGDDLVSAYRAADLFLFPSTTETFGLVALEAMACGVPVIAANTGGVLDIINDGQTGLLFDPERPAQLGLLVAQLKANPSLRAALAERGLAHARSRSWQATMDQLIDYYHLARRVWRIKA
ncbi:MAG: glycosyltransferase family 4 protein [Oscillochloridaceae bacterium umkhey_bin13]